MKRSPFGIALCVLLAAGTLLLAGCQTTETRKSKFGTKADPQPKSALGRASNAIDNADDKIQDVLWGPQ